jgi:hypothetical protein
MRRDAHQPIDSWQSHSRVRLNPCLVRELGSIDELHISAPSLHLPEHVRHDFAPFVTLSRKWSTIVVR